MEVFFLLKYLLSFVLLSFLLVACSNMNDSSINNKESVNTAISIVETPPEGYLIYEDVKVPLVMGTYSWNDTEADSDPPNKLILENGMELITPPNSQINIQFLLDKNPQKLEVYHWEDLDQGEEITLVNNTSFTAPHIAGEYIIGIVATWPEGIVFYGIKIKVIE